MNLLVRPADRSKNHPNIVDLETRIKDMDKYGISKQVTCIYQGLDPNHLPIENAREQIRLCKSINDDMAEAMKKSKGRIFALGTAPLRGLDVGGVEEMRRAIKDLGLRGFMALLTLEGNLSIISNYSGKKQIVSAFLFIFTRSTP